MCSGTLDGRFALPWRQGATVEILQQGIRNSQAQQHEPHMSNFRKHTGMLNILLSNKTEGTLPANVDKYSFSTSAPVAKELDSQDNGFLPQPPLPWIAEGHQGKSATHTQLIQHARAQQYLFGKPQLNSCTVKMTHKILMWGAEDNGQTVLAGEYRTHPAYSALWEPASLRFLGIPSFGVRFMLILCSLRNGLLSGHGPSAPIRHAAVKGKAYSPPN
ncbi:hypothetical protein VOLCADRAFT_93579 [Volvox carteri f. nagariensis]|uniref:Uncharacterized protein n=1 Tax=Volvox carteri f. nagariensis TaxID=3068 RepID=D8U2H5_VOLCA|nr:uncharacterized protein VOLCADRAFT_93579 [Volvox carteri f. nagariensis]EFJ46135.1 hypothetical protein VOLCADRAFT_93579 [Volvox carteri f. nagariensis]|eukprot:XP_002952885.1 hypothetical protein VOLCADRAFT_93579 [Volvox carteri f. nagariensis]